MISELQVESAVDHEYLLSYGISGEFGRFRPTRPMVCCRGDRGVIRTYRGVELGIVLCEARSGHANYLPNTTVGALLRLASPTDEQTDLEMKNRAQRLYEASRTIVAEHDLPLEILDVEVLLDGEHAFLHHLAWGEFDERDLVSTLAHGSNLFIALHRLAPVEKAEETEETEHGCGKPDCGRAGGSGGCSSCGTGGGCSSCGTAKPEAVQAYFAGLREQMAVHARTPLL